MQYNISLEHLEKIANPFEQISLSGLTHPIKIEDINTFIETGKNPLKEQNIYSILLEKAINKILNFDKNEPLIINLDSPINPESGWIVENVEQLTAMLFWKSHLNLQYVPAHIEGNNELVKKLFKPEDFELENQSNLETTEIIEKKHKVKVFDWKNTQKVKVNKEDAKTAVLQEESISSILKLSTPTMWKDTDFVKQVFEKFTDQAGFELYLQDIPFNYLFSETIINLAKENDKIFQVVWQKYKAEAEKKRKNLANNDNKVEQALVVLKPLFENENLVTNIFNSKNYRYISEFLEFIPDRFLLKKENIEISLGLINSSQMHSDVLNLFPKRYFNKIENVFEFLNACGYNGRTIATGSGREYITKIIVKDRDTFLKALDHPSLLTDYLPNNILSTLYVCINSDLKKDKEIIKKMIHLGLTDVLDNYYVEIDDLTIEIIEAAFKNGYKGTKIPESKAFKMKDVTAQSAYLKAKPGAVVSEEFPIEWLNHTDNLEAAAARLLWKKLPKNTQSLILDNRALLKKLVANNPNFYSDLPLTYKIDVEIAKEYVFGFLRNSAVDKDKCMREVPKGVWLNKQFSLEVVTHTLKYAKNIPKEYLNDKDFILQLFKKVSKFRTNELILKLPKEIANFFNDNAITQNHTEFLEKVFFHHDLDNTISEKQEIPVVKKKKI